MSTRIKELRLKNHLTLMDVAKHCGVSEGTAQRWESGAVPNLKYNTIIMLAELFGVSPSYLMGWEDNGTQSDVPYYLDEETAEIAQEVYERPELKILFDASRKASKEDIQFVVEMIDRMAKKERGED